MKFNAKELKRGEHAGRFAVFQGKKYWVSTLRDTFDKADQLARSYTAKWHLSKASAALEGITTVELFYPIGHLADAIVREVTDKAEKFDDNFNPQDEGGWLA